MQRSVFVVALVSADDPQPASRTAATSGIGADARTLPILGRTLDQAPDVDVVVRVALAFVLLLVPTGTPGDDRLAGTERRDSILAGRGDDRIAAGRGNDFVDAGLGNDVVYAGEGNDAVYGGPGSDRVVGGPGRDFLAGNAGDDVVDARDRSTRRLADCTRPCWRPKVPSSADIVSADPGDDRIYARDGRVDAIRCQSGHDVVSADRVDVISPFGDCEVVLRG